ncbi:hypothetical protein CASFOL_013705 [Castilleja foliolosa]|uniref:Uncharacterized protein n=1 Tax=Castilleja foliolosa TaxID=1961234 RepID=A0ABD3DKS8_9LAMI
MASSKPRSSSSCSFLNLLISFLNFILFILSATSLAPTILLKMPPTSLGWAFIITSTISLFSSFIGFFPRLARLCHVTHISLLLASAVAQLLGVLALFAKEKSSLVMFGSTRDPREAKVLVRLECGVLMAMFVMQLGVLILCCAAHSCGVRECEGVEAEKRMQRIASVQEESMANYNAAKIVELKNKELGEKVNINKYGQFKNDFQGYK